MVRTSGSTQARLLAERLPGFSPNCPKRNVVASLAYLHIGLTILSLPSMI